MYIFVQIVLFLPLESSYEDVKEIIKLKTGNNQLISAVYLQNRRAKYTIVYIHGNAEDLGQIPPSLAKLKDLDFSVFAYDYRSYGTSAGKTTEKAAYKNVETASLKLLKNNYSS